MFPIGDDNTGRRTTPYATWTLIALNVLVFVLLQGCGTNQRFTYAFSTVPAEIVTGRDVVTPDRRVVDPRTRQGFVAPGLGRTPVPVYLTLLIAIFMHGGIAHLFGNMMFLGVFGDNVEDDLGRTRYVAFYLACGLLASLTHVATTYAFKGNPLVPSLGASGAISGVLAAYLRLHPRRWVRVFVGYFVTEVRAIVAIGLWFAFQVISGLGALGSQASGVAYGAHVGGFVAGFLLLKLFLPRGREFGEDPPPPHGLRRRGVPVVVYRRR